MWMMCEARSRQFEVWQEKGETKMFTKRTEPIMLITCWYLCFPFSRALWFAIHCRCLARRCSASSPLTFFMIPSLALYLIFLFRVCLLFTLIPSTISHLWNQTCRARWCLRQYADAVITLLGSFIKRDGSIYVYIQTLAQNWTAIIKISCLVHILTIHIKTFPVTNHNHHTDSQHTNKKLLLVPKSLDLIPPDPRNPWLSRCIPAIVLDLDI